MKFIRHQPYLFALLLSSVTLSSNAALPHKASPIESIAGNYICEGFDPFEKKNFKSSLTIRKTNETYSFEASEEGVEGLFKGTGILDKTKPDILAAVCSSPSQNEIYLALYQILADGTLQATWSMLGADRTATEICKKV